MSEPSVCNFYHTISLPGLGLIEGTWDLRADVDSYLGLPAGVTYEGKRVIDVGTASGYLAFEMEKRGADVVGLDRLIATPLDEMGLVPFSDFDRRFGQGWEETIKLRVHQHFRLQNSFWLAHRLLMSKARLYCGSVFNQPGPESGEFDYAFFGAVLLHLRDPLQAIYAFSKVTREKIIITDVQENIGAYAEAPVMFFRPTITDDTNPGTWWYITPALLKSFLEVLGFRRISIINHEATWTATQQKVPFYTIVGSRL